MERKTFIIPLAAALTIALSAGAFAQTGRGESPWPRINWTQLSNNCEFGEQIDGSSAVDAKRRMESAGFAGVRDLRKGCDNVWHAKANANGSEVNIALSPDGQIFRETE